MGQGRRIRRALSALARWLPALVAALPAWSHQGGLTGYATLRVEGDRVRYELTLSQWPSSADAGRDPSGLLEALAGKVRISAGDAPCAPGTAQARPPAPGRLSLTLTVDYACPTTVSELRVRDDFYDVAGADLHTLAKVVWPEGQDTFAFATERREARFEVARGAPAAARPASFFLLGVEHILTGYDHLLFLMALLVCATSWIAVLKVVTAFTLAHSLTLALAVCGLVTPPERLVEAAIALSIAYVAADNLGRARRSPGRWGASFLFGLVHGLGFSAALREMHLPREGMAWLLLQFNLGVEAGQAAAASLALVVLAALRATRWHEPATRGISLAILAAGCILLVTRTLY